MRSTWNSVFFILSCAASGAWASEPTRIEIDPLSLYARTVYPESVTTIGGAARYLLEPTGYTLAIEHPAPADARTIGNRAIPPIAKLHRTMPIIDALQILIGTEKWIVVDRHNKLISFSEKRS
ncbi:hypothetical protein LCGC14_0393340 [marine sediment metagenome]|uniref:Uncharacterized protein n=3 Tax=root TaxID=1 RepID=A0A7V1BL79_9GAMM|nr:hypothetical protein [Marinobacter antarcticus]HDZ55289.1 hypothetical protein [Halopseudomonas xinjiangensis]HEA51677.1 hypothetical protein [Marinobacter antarcticus]